MRLVRHPPQKSPSGPWFAPFLSDASARAARMLERLDEISRPQPSQRIAYSIVTTS
jgi:hypothetical protein